MSNNVTYIKCCILANKLPDIADDTLLRKDVKLIKTNAKNLNFDIDHNNKYLSGIEIVENYINQSDEKINNNIIPAGSWIMVLAIYNNTLNELISKKELTGVSLRTELGEDIQLYDPISNGRVPYNNIINKEAMQPSSISFTNMPANELPFEVMTYEVYTAKNNKQRTDNMKENQNDSELGFWRKLASDLFTAKNITPQIQPQNTLSGINTEEFINSMIESNKAIPKQTELISKLLETQTKTVDGIAALTSKIQEMELSVSEMKLSSQEKPPVNEEQKIKLDEDPKDPQKEEDPEDPEDPKNLEDPKDPQKEGDPENLEDPKNKDPKYTAKSRKPLRRQDPIQNNKEEIMRFIANRSYNDLLKQ